MASSKRNCSASEADTTSKKFKSAKDIPRDSASEDRVSYKTDEKGDKYWELSAKRRVTVSQFKGAMLVGLREFYDKDGKTLPGKQGIALNVDQFVALLKAIPAIKAALVEQGVELETSDAEEEVEKSAGKAEADSDADEE